MPLFSLLSSFMGLKRAYCCAHDITSRAGSRTSIGFSKAAMYVKIAKSFAFRWKMIFTDSRMGESLTEEG